MLSAHLNYLLEAQQPADFARLGEHLPYEWVEQAVQATGTASVRRRRLPAEQVVWLVIALALPRPHPTRELVNILNRPPPPRPPPFVSKPAGARPRKRTGRPPAL